VPSLIDKSLRFIYLVLIMSALSCAGPGSKEFYDAKEVYHKGDYNQAIEHLTQGINRGDVNDRNMAQLYAARAAAYYKIGSYEKAMPDLRSASIYAQNRAFKQKIKNFMHTISYEFVSSPIYPGGISFKDGWNGLRWGSNLEDFKKSHAISRINGSFFITGDEKEMFCEVPVQVRYYFNKSNEFYSVAFFPSKEDRYRLCDEMRNRFGEPSSAKAEWLFFDLEISCKRKGIAAVIKNRNYQPAPSA